MPLGLQKGEEDSDRIVLCEVDAGSGGEASELAHLLFKLSQISKQLEHHDCSLHQHITEKILKTKADIIEMFVNGTPTSNFIAKVVHRIRSIQRDVERLENRHSSRESSRENSAHDVLSYVVHKINNDNYRLKINKRDTAKSQNPTPLKTQLWTRNDKTKRTMTLSSTSFKTKPQRKNKHKMVKSISKTSFKTESQRKHKHKQSKPKESEPARENQTVKEDPVAEPKVIVPISDGSTNKTPPAGQSCKCCYLEKFQKDQAEMKRTMILQPNVKQEKNSFREPISSRRKETAGVCTIVPSRTSVSSRNKAWGRLDPRCSYKVLKRCPAVCCPVHNKHKELKNGTSCSHQQKKDTLYSSAKAFAKSVAGRGAAFISPMHPRKKCIPVNVENETILLPPPPSNRQSPKRIACKDLPSEKPVCKTTVPKLQNVDKATSYEKFYINPLGLPDKRFRPVENKLINEEWRYFGDDYPLKLDKIEHFKGEGVEYTIRRPVEAKMKIDNETQTDGPAFPVEYKVANMNIVYSKTHLKYIVPGWKESSAETVSTPKILCKKELEDGLAVTTYKMDPDGTVYFTLAYSTDATNEDELNVQHSENHLRKLKSVKDVWIQSARHLYKSLKTAYSATSSRDSSH